MKRNILRNLIIVILCSALILTILYFAFWQHTHLFGEWIIEKEATCSETGIKVQYCSCGESRTSVISKTEHTPGEWITDTEHMIRTLYCSVCHEAIRKESVDEHSHIWSEWTTERVATCTSYGLESRTCECGKTEERTVAILPHSFDSWHTLTEATCEKPGLLERFCSCGKRETLEITALGHAKADHYTENETIYYYCPRCLKILKTEPLKADVTLKVENGYVIEITGFVGGQIVIPATYNGEAITAIGKEAFKDMTEITSVVLPSTVSLIGDKAFYGCSNLKSVNLENVKSIGKAAFGYCEYLSRITLGNELENIGTWAFEYCNSLLYISFNGTREQWNEIDKGKDWNLGIPNTAVDCLQ